MDHDAHYIPITNMKIILCRPTYYLDLQSSLSSLKPPMLTIEPTGGGLWKSLSQNKLHNQ